MGDQRLEKWTVVNELSDDEDEAAELMRELEKIKKERQEQKEKEVCSYVVCSICHPC